MQPIDRFRGLVESTSWEEIEFARSEVTPEDVPALARLYWSLDDWPPRVALVQLVQDQNHPALRPVMLHILRAPLDPDGDNVELTKAYALCALDHSRDFTAFYEDRQLLHSTVTEVLDAARSVT